MVVKTNFRSIVRFLTVSVFAAVLMLMSIMPLTNVVSGEGLQSGYDFSNTTSFYNKLKESIVEDTDRLTSTCFNEDINTAKEAMGVGINIGNELDWNWGSDNVTYGVDSSVKDTSVKYIRMRRYLIRVSVGYENGEGETEYYYFEHPFNASGNLFTYVNRPSLEQDYANISLTQAKGLTLSADMPVNYVKVQVINTYNVAQNLDFNVNVRKFEIYDQTGNNLLSGNTADGTYKTKVPSKSPNITLVFKKTIDTTVGDFYGDSANLHADVQLEDFISDYKNRPSLIYQHSNNEKFKLNSNQLDMNELDSLLTFLWDEGIRSIRLPVTWYCHMDATGTVDPEWFSEVNKIVQRMTDKGFYVIVNIHGDTGEKGWIKADRTLFNEYRSTYKYLCLQIAQNFKNFDHHLILQGPNEVLNYKNYKTNSRETPITDDEYDVMNELNQIFVDEVRFTGYNNTNRFLLCNTYYSARLNIPKYALPNDSATNKIFVGIHDYTILEDGMLSSLNFFASDEGRQYLERYNIVMDEFGIKKTEPLEKRLQLMETSVKKGYELGIPMLLWEEGSGYAIMDKKEYKWDTAYSSDQVAAAMLRSYSSDEAVVPLGKRLLQNGTSDIPDMNFTFTFTQQSELDGEIYESAETPIAEKTVLVTSESDQLPSDDHVGNLTDKNLYHEEIANVLDDFNPNAAGTYAYIVAEKIPDQKQEGVTYTSTEFLMVITVKNINGELKVTNVQNNLYKDSNGKKRSDYMDPPAVFDDKYDLIFYNNYDTGGGTTPTGISTNVWSFIVIGASGAGALALYVILNIKNKRKKIG